MIDLPNDFKPFYDKDLVLYEKQIAQLKRKAINAKDCLLSEQFVQFNKYGSKDDHIEFIVQTMELVFDLALFPDDLVINRLKELGFTNEIIKWFVKLDDVLIEIERLSNIHGVLFFKYSLLFVISTHLQLKAMITAVENFGLHEFHNNTDTNLLYKWSVKLYRRVEYNKSKRQEPKMNAFDRQILNIFKMVENKTDKAIARKYILQTLKGNTSLYITMLDQFYNKGISRNEVYRELFPLLKMVMKDTELLSDEEYFATKDDKYDANYNSYKIARVKKILQK
jgi:hypothetical protein